jgi:hypothetical protein
MKVIKIETEYKILKSKKTGLVRRLILVVLFFNNGEISITEYPLIQNDFSKF